MESIGKRTVRKHPPTLGEHSEAVLGDFGLAADEIAALVADGVVAVAERKNP